MRGRCAASYLLLLTLVSVQQSCWGSDGSEDQGPEASERVALPRVSCSARRIRAVFGPFVRDNVLIRGRLGRGGDLWYLSTRTGFVLCSNSFGSRSAAHVLHKVPALSLIRELIQRHNCFNKKTTY